MAGYIVSLDSIDALGLYTRCGVYATKLSVPTGVWKLHHEGTFADYTTMQAGDNIYFFIKRKIYGIGRLVSLHGECKFFNFPTAAIPSQASYEEVQSDLLWDEGLGSENQRLLCTFEPDPAFFTAGIDMDDVLASNPSAFKMLRAFWKVSFIKFDDDENQAFRDILLKRNQRSLSRGHESSTQTTFPFVPSHNEIIMRLKGKDFSIQTGMATILSSCAQDDHLRHEMAIEAGLVHQLAVKDPLTCGLLGEWDYISHQVIASPFKPIDYMDRMDLFGYAYLPGFKPTKAQFLVGEIKKDSAQPEDVDQLLKYVDWVCDEYCFGDYSMIRSCLIAHDFDDHVIAHCQEVATRRYTIGVRPAQSLEWHNLKLITYSFNAMHARLDFAAATQTQR